MLTKKKLIEEHKEGIDAIATKRKVESIQRTSGKQSDEKVQFGYSTKMIPIFG